MFIDAICFLIGAIIVALAVVFRPKLFTFYCDQHKGRVQTNTPYLYYGCPVCEPEKSKKYKQIIKG